QTPNISTGVAGFVVPGNKVDVLLTMHAGGMDDSSGGGTTMALLQNVTVLAVDQKIEAPTDNKIDVKDMRSVTLVVTPWEANQLDLGQNKGTLRLALRNPLDDDVTEIPNATLKRLRGGAVEVLANGEVAATPPPAAVENALASTEAGLPPATAVTAPAPAPESRRVRMPILCLRGNQMSSTRISGGRVPASQSGKADLLVKQ
ncbi:MAG: Flp pilus assembly protein CpaB, partial [Planctomycetaceae bacterium]